MRYFLRADTTEDIETGFAVLIRLEADAPWSLAESLKPSGEWSPTEHLARYHLLGSADVEITEITAGRAREIVVIRHDAGRLHELPQPMPGDDGPELPARTPEAMAEREALRASAQAMQDTINQRWAQVRTPEGAESVGLPPSDD